MNSAFYLKLKFQPDSIGFNSSRNHVPKFSQEVLLSRNLCMKEEVNHLLSSVNGGAVVVEVCLYDEEISKKVNLSHIFYYVWLGKTTNLMDTIEIPPFNPPSASLSNIFENNTIVSVRFYPTIPTAKDVALKPKSSLDWDVVQHHAGFIENNLLRSLSLITLDQELSISITPSIAANFNISKMEYLEDRLTENKTDDFTRNKRRTKKEVARISNQTQLIIEPYVAEGRNFQDVSSNGNTITKNSDEKQATAQGVSENGNWQNLNLQSVSEMVLLRILPQRFRYCNSFFPSPHPASSQPLQNNTNVLSIKAQKSSIQTLIHDDDYLNSFLISSVVESSNDLIDSRKEENTSSFPWTHHDHYTSELTQSKTITPSRLMKNSQIGIQNSSGKDRMEHQSHLGSSALCDAFIHPLYLKTLLELKTSRSSLTKEDLLALLNDTTYPFLAYVTRSSASHHSSPSGIAERSLVRVYCTEKIQPFMISLPSIVERALGVGEYDFVTLILLLRHRPSAPASINLHPISWTQNSKSGKGGLISGHLDSSSYKKDVTKSSPQSGTQLSPELFSTLSLNQVIDAFLRFIQKQSTSSSPFLFAHQSILTLSLPLTQSKNTNIPASNISSSNLIFSTPTKSPSITSNANTPAKSIPSITTCNVDFLIEFTGVNQIKGKGNMNSSESAMASSEIPYLPVCYDDLYYEENIYKIISLLSLEKDFPVHGILPSTFQPVSQSSSSITPPLLTIGWEKILNAIMKELYYQFSPEFLFQRWEQQFCQPSTFFSPNFLIVGEEKTGKTSLLTILRQQIGHQINQSLQIKILTIACKDLLISPPSSSSSTTPSKSLKDLLAELDEIFEQCMMSTPCLLLLDDIDVLCPSSSLSLNGEVARDERQIVLTCYVQQKLNEITRFVQTKRRRAKILYDSNASSALFNKVAVMSELLGSSIVVAGTVKSLPSFDPCLLCSPENSGSDVGFAKYFQLPTSLPINQPIAVTSEDSDGKTREEQDGSEQSNAWKILYHYLTHSGIPLFSDSLVDSTISTKGFKMVDYSQIAERLNRLKYGDFPAVLQCIKYEVSLRLFEQYSNVPPTVASSSLSSTQPSVYTTLSDIDQALERYLSLPSSSLPSAAYNTAPINKERLQRSFELIKNSSFFQPLHRQILSTIYYPTIYSPLYRHLPIRLPRAIMLYGLPGCGKTFLAQTIGHYYYGSSISQASSFITIKGPQLLNKYIGESEKSIRQLFQTAKEQASTQRGSGNNTGVVIFFDEFEALAPKRGKDNTGITDRIVNQLLTFIDGVESTMTSSSSSMQEEEEEEDQKISSSIYIMIATSRPDLIDGALLRPGRIEQHLYVGLPDTSSKYEELLLAMLSPYLSPSSPSRDQEGNQSGDELTLSKAAVQDICCDEKIFSLTMADLQAMIDTAYLKAVHQKIAKKEKKRSNGVLNQELEESGKIYITADTIRQAFFETKPSLHTSDRMFYEQVYTPFRSSSSSLLPGKGINKNQLTPARLRNGNHENGKSRSHQSNGDISTENKNSAIDLQQKISFR